MNNVFQLFVWIFVKTIFMFLSDVPLKKIKFNLFLVLAAINFCKKSSSVKRRDEYLTFSENKLRYFTNFI